MIFLKYSNRLQLDLIQFWPIFCGQKLILNGGAIRPTGLLFTRSVSKTPFSELCPYLIPPFSGSFPC